MGRTLKRVPLDFNWPIKQIWKGYINPYKSQGCKSCDNTGLNKATKKLNDDWYAFDNPKWVEINDGKSRYNDNAWSHHITEVEVKALLEHNRLYDFTRVPLNDEQVQVVKDKIASGGNSWLPYDNGYIPTPEEVNKWSTGAFGHDSINRNICVKARAKHIGVYGLCEICEGEGEIWFSEEIKKFHEEWVCIEPPVGYGFQLWETTSEGSPNSPVFKTLEELCEWCAENTTTFARYKATKKEWMKMLDEDNVYHGEGNALFM